MSRVQLALDVSDIDQAVAFYSKLFATPVHKRRDGYANFVIEDPPLKLVLIEAETGGRLNHLGVEVDTADEVTVAEARLAGEGMATTGVDDTTCCYAHKTETWVADPDGAPWEWYVRTGDADQMRPTDRSGGTTGKCCTPGTATAPVATGAGAGAATEACC